MEMNSSEARWGGGVTLLLFILIFLPLVAVLANVVIPGIFFGRVEFQGLNLLGDIFVRPLWRQSLWNSVSLAFGVATLGTVLGGALAMIRAQWDFAVGRLLDVTAWALLIVPSFMLAQGWVLFASRDGLMNQWLGGSGCHPPFSSHQVWSW
jgi:iron(III) transport system permease protein